MIAIRSVRERGFTLVEAMIVMILAGVVTVGLLAFYFNSQATWLDASSQALAQRDATMLIQAIARETRQASRVSVTDCPGQLVIYQGANGTNAVRNFRWNAPGDSLVHVGSGACNSDQGPVITSVVEEFSLAVQTSPPLLQLVRLRVRSATGERVEMSSSFALYNAP